MKFEWENLLEGIFRIYDLFYFFENLIYWFFWVVEVLDVFFMGYWDDFNINFIISLLIKVFIKGFLVKIVFEVLFILK